MSENWKQTVIKPDKLGLTIIEHPELPMGQAIALEQAKHTGDICYKAGVEAGRREVVKWVENNLVGDTENYITMNSRKWDGKLKDWGIE